MAVVLVGMLLLVPSRRLVLCIEPNPSTSCPQVDSRMQAWSLQTGVAFDSVASAQHTSTSIDSGRLTMDHEREPNRDQAMLWATTSETGSSQALGAPDGLMALSQGPLITVEGFDAGILVHHASTSCRGGCCLHDSRSAPRRHRSHPARHRFGCGVAEDDLQHESSAVRYTSTQPWSTNITSFVDLTWEALANLSLTFDYVSQAPDDSRLEVDAIGIRITVQAPLNGIEFAIAEHIMPLDVFPLLEIDFLNGTLEEGAHAPCGIRAGDNGIRWFSEPIVLPPEQSGVASTCLGRS